MGWLHVEKRRRTCLSTPSKGTRLAQPSTFCLHHGYRECPREWYRHYGADFVDGTHFQLLQEAFGGARQQVGIEKKGAAAELLAMEARLRKIEKQKQSLTSKDKGKGGKSGGGKQKPTQPKDPSLVTPSWLVNNEKPRNKRVIKVQQTVRNDPENDESDECSKHLR